MSDLAQQYRQLADKARADAEAASLANVREVHLRSAERLDHIVRGIESVALAKSRNEEARVSAAASASPVIV